MRQSLRTLRQMIRNPGRDLKGILEPPVAWLTGSIVNDGPHLSGV